MSASDSKKECGDDTSPDVSLGNDEPYSIFTTKEKWLIVAMVGLAGFYRSV
jgi:hypothetical protein